MPLYQFKATTLDGKPTRGQMQATDKNALHEQLMAQKMYLTTCEEVSVQKQGTRLSAMQLSEFCRELGMMLGAGVPLIRAISIMAKRDVKENVKLVYQSLYRSLRQGSMLSEAMALQPRAFPQLLISMMRASEANGAMDTTAIRMAEHYDRSHRLNRKVRSAMTYPMVLACITVVVLLVVFLLILPRFFKLFESIGAELPGITKFMLGFSLFLTNWWVLLLVGVAALIIGVKALKKIPSVEIAFDRAKLRIPIAGKLLRTIYTARFARTLSTCYSSGISIISALNNTRDTVGNAYIASQFKGMIAKVREGQPLSAAIGQIDGFDNKLAATVLIGEETGRLYDMLNSMADSFDYESEIALGRLTTLIEPVMIVVMAVVILLVIVSVMLPMTSMYDAIGGTML